MRRGRFSRSALSRARFSGAPLSRVIASTSILFIAACARDAAPVASVGASVAPAASRAFAPPGAADAWPARPSLARRAEVAWAGALPPLDVECANTGARAAIRLYAPDGSVDPAATAAFAEVAADTNGLFPLKERLLQLAVKSARHFDAKTLTVVSAYRRPRGKRSGDHHTKGEALDFRLSGVDYRQLAAYLRSLPRVGVGIYTDPRTHYVHLDVRDRSFHWLDASPPGVLWREASLPDAEQAARDAAYTEETDLPFEPRR